MKTTFKIIRFFYLIIAYFILIIIGLITYPFRKFLMWFLLIDDAYLTYAPESTFVDWKIRQNNRVNLMFMYRWNDKVVELINNKIDK
jgi:hypothetical protein